MKVFALHGGYLGPEDLRRDMGDPRWVDHYLDGHDPVFCESQIRQWIIPGEKIVLLGYSFGGSVIGHLSQRFQNTIRSAVLYESPLIGTNTTGGKFPVLWIRNMYLATRFREAEFDWTRSAWQRTHRMTYRFGSGKHVKPRWGWPPFGHAWDRSLNSFIENWI